MFDIEKRYCKCKKCGYEDAEIDARRVLASYPPMYEYKCPECGEIGYINCSEARLEKIEDEEKMKEQTNKALTDFVLGIIRDSNEEIIKMIYKMQATNVILINYLIEKDIIKYNDFDEFFKKNSKDVAEHLYNAAEEMIKQAKENKNDGNN